MSAPDATAYHRSLDYIANLPESDLLEHLRTMPLSVLRAFHRRHGLSDREGMQHCGWDLPLATHAIILARLHPALYGEPPAPTQPTDAYNTDDKADAMAARAERGEGLRHPADFLQADSPLLGGDTGTSEIALRTSWARAEGKLRIVGLHRSKQDMPPCEETRCERPSGRRPAKCRSSVIRGPLLETAGTALRDT